MKRIALASGLLAVMSCLPLTAQTLNLKADVPFDFQFGDVPMRAGHYQVVHAGPVLTMRSADGRSSASYLTLPASRSETRTKGVLVFNRYGNAYFLTKVVPPNEGDGRIVPKSKLEKEVIARVAVVGTETAALKRK
jgi:hypothetical protein